MQILSIGQFPIEIKIKIKNKIFYLMKVITTFHKISYWDFYFDRKSSLRFNLVKIGEAYSEVIV